jgi:hypothetical protein
MWLIPSHRRPDKLFRLLSSLNLDDFRHEGAVVVSASDRELVRYKELELPSGWFLAVCPPEVTFLGEKLNWAFEQWRQEPWYGFLADDLVKQEGDLEDLIVAAESWNIAYPDDGYHGEGMCTHFCLGGKLARTAGWLAMPWFKQNCIDSVWYEVGMVNGLLRYCPQVRFEHLHPGLSKGQGDATYQRAMGLNQEAGWVFDNLYVESMERKRLHWDVQDALGLPNKELPRVGLEVVNG